MVGDNGLEPLVYTPKEFARLMHVSNRHVYDLVAAGEIRSVRLGDKILIPKTEVERILNGEPKEGA